MNNSEIAEIIDEANKLLHKDFPLMSPFDKTEIKYIFKAVENLGYTIKEE